MKTHQNARKVPDNQIASEKEIAEAANTNAEQYNYFKELFEKQKLSS